jgi:hypothetical protein
MAMSSRTRAFQPHACSFTGDWRPSLDQSMRLWWVDWKLKSRGLEMRSSQIVILGYQMICLRRVHIQGWAQTLIKHTIWMLTIIRIDAVIMKLIKMQYGKASQIPEKMNWVWWKKNDEHKIAAVRGPYIPTFRWTRGLRLSVGEKGAF